MIRTAHLADDFDGIHGVWRELEWIRDGARDRLAIESLAGAGHNLVVDIDGIQAHATSHRAIFRHTRTDLDSCLVAGVLVGRTARRQGWARKLTAELVSTGAQKGAAVSMLGVFDQGFYERLGFGMGPAVHFSRFDPRAIKVDVPDRTPVRLTPDDNERILANRLRGPVGHGAFRDPNPGVQLAEMSWGERDSFGLGYEDAHGALTHHVWFKSEGEDGPWRIKWLAWETPQQLRELMGLLKSQADQIFTMSLYEPAGLFVQDWLARPGRQVGVRKQGSHRLGCEAEAWWAVRIVDMPVCIAAVQAFLPLSLVVEIDDPMAAESAAWNGVGGPWTLHLDRTSSATRGSTERLPVLRAGVAAFSQLWMGSRTARALSCLGLLDGPPELIDALDDALRLPLPDADWEV
jgi:hypothetical protein